MITIFYLHVFIIKDSMNVDTNLTYRWESTAKFSEWNIYYVWNFWISLVTKKIHILAWIESSNYFWKFFIIILFVTFRLPFLSWKKRYSKLSSVNEQVLKETYFENIFSFMPECELDRYVYRKYMIISINFHWESLKT